MAIKKYGSHPQCIPLSYEFSKVHLKCYWILHVNDNMIWYIIKFLSIMSNVVSKGTICSALLQLKKTVRKFSSDIGFDFN